VRKEIYPIGAWDGIQPNCMKMEEALDLCGNRTDTERLVGYMCVCVYGYVRAEMEAFCMCLEEGSLQNLCEQEREEKLCVCVCVCACMRGPTLTLWPWNWTFK
jgi:hypothetical protein